MKRIAAAVACVAALGATPALADGNKIVQSGRAFHPTEITIPAGTTLDFSNEDEFLHQIYVDSEGFPYDSAEQPPGQTLHITFKNGGTFPVRCHIHPKMLLTVHVK